MLIAVIGVCAVFEKPSSMSKYVKKRETEERYCGSKLADKLREVCSGKYEGLDDIYEGVNNTYDGVNNTYDGVNNTYDGVNNTYDGVSNTYDGVSNTYDGVSNTYEGMNNTYEGVNNTYEGMNNTYEGVNNTRKRGTNFFHRRPPQGVAKFVFRFLNDFTLIVKITWQRVKRTCKIKVTHQILKIIHFAQTPRYFAKTHLTNNLI
jgi:archaellum component FlaC